MTKLSYPTNVMRDLIRTQVDHPECIEIEELRGQQATILEVSHHPEDGRRLTGKDGRVINALGEILRCYAGREKRHYNLTLVGASASSRRPVAIQERLTERAWIDTLSGLVTRVVGDLVNSPDRVRVNVLEGWWVVVLEVDVAPEDRSQVLGTRGRTIEALRELLVNPSAMARRNFHLVLMDDWNGRYHR
jgi:predicted RNA-binding protein YlqC (UPF0109 family)